MVNDEETREEKRAAPSRSLLSPPVSRGVGVLLRTEGAQWAVDLD